MANKVTISDSVATTSSTTAASSTAVKSAYDLAQNAQWRIDTQTGNFPASTSEDTTTYWRDIPNGVYWYSEAGHLLNQPNTYGFLVHNHYGSDVHQTFHCQNAGPLFSRSGNAGGWYESWREIPYRAELSNYQPIKRCIVGQNSSTNTNPWYKFASIDIVHANEDRYITFLVTGTYAENTKKSGILMAHTRTNNPISGNQHQLKWLCADSSIELSHFVLGYKATDSVCSVELWCYCPSAWQLFEFEVLSEHTRTSSNWNLYTLYNKQSAGSDASIPADLTQVQSTFGYASCERVRFSNGSQLWIA